MKIRPPSEFIEDLIAQFKADKDFMKVATAALKPMGVTPAKFFEMWRTRGIKGYAEMLKKEVKLTVASQKKVLAQWKKEGYPKGAWK